MNTQALTVVTQAVQSDDMQRKFVTLLPPSVRPEKFTEVTLAAIQNAPDVLEADRDSLYRACVAAARRGLLPDKREGALVVYNTNVGTQDQPKWMRLVQFMPMVEGIIKEMAKAGIEAYAVSVYANDEIELWNDDAGQHVLHKPKKFGDQGPMVGVFAAAKTSTGRTYVEPMNLKDIGQVARRSKQCKVDKSTGEIIYGGTWKSDFDRMGQKSALHRLRKRLPITDEDALQNLKDMEEESDVDVAAADKPTPDRVSTEESGSSPPPDKPAKAPRRSRVLRDIVDNGSPSKPAQTEAAGAPGAESTAGAAPTTVVQDEPPPWGDDDIV